MGIFKSKKIKKILKKNPNISKASEVSGISRSTLRRMSVQLKINVGQKKGAK